MSGLTDGDDLDRETLARSFDATAAAYELGRPDYPDEALSFWDGYAAFERDASVLDLVAGAGKLTRLLPVTCRVHAVEPLPQMRQQFVAAVPDVEVLVGTAEQIPFDDDTFDTVLVGQAFHWFDQDVALDEIARVLKPSGGLGLIWNEDDVGAAAWMSDIVDEKRSLAASTVVGDHPVVDVLGGHCAFGPVASFECRWQRETSIEGVLADILSRSYVSAMPTDDQLAVLTRSREAIEGHLGVGVERVEYPYRTVAFWSALAKD